MNVPRGAPKRLVVAPPPNRLVLLEKREPPLGGGPPKRLEPKILLVLVVPVPKENPVELGLLKRLEVVVGLKSEPD